MDYLENELKGDFMKIFLDLYKAVEQRNEDDFKLYREGYSTIIADYFCKIPIVEENNQEKSKLDFNFHLDKEEAEKQKERKLGNLNKLYRDRKSVYAIEILDMATKEADNLALTMKEKLNLLNSKFN